jgi:exopolysaccharide biosynthesis polyprenyl glycosylphosphotransferase
MKILTLLQKKHSDESNAPNYAKYRLLARSPDMNLYPEKFFLNFLHLERKRSERSHRPFMLVVIGLKGFSKTSERREIIKDITSVLSSTTRDIDMKGWYRHNEAIGIIFNEISANIQSFQTDQQHTLNKVWGNLTEYLGLARFDRLDISYQIFPGDFVTLPKAKPGDLSQHLNLFSPPPAKKVAFTIKRIIDIIGSLSAIVLFTPVFLLVAALIKLNSKGSVFFKQERVGLYGKKFMFLKFRSMYTNNDPSIHKEFVRNLIQGCNADHGKNIQNVKNFKIKDDPRVTSIGMFLRKTSIDELPQFFNVLMGDMSLVGPRPPIPYECEDYDIWHRSRVLDMKPGITGLWQVDGRSATSFDDMVRMDIKYIREWSLLLDMKIIVKTPLVVLTCKGAY